MTKFDEGINIIDKAMKKLGIKYAFISGTALGLCRDGVCIPTDTDIDFVIHTQDRPRLSEIRGALGISEISHMGYMPNPEVIGFGMGEYEWIELDFLHTKKDKVWHAWEDGERWIANVYPKRMWDNLEYIYAYGVKCPVFHPIEEYLELTYGKDWRTPNKNYTQENFNRVTETRKYDWSLDE